MKNESYKQFLPSMHLRKISSALHVALESLSFSNVRLSTVEIAELNQQQQQRGQRERFLKKQFATCTSPIIHLVCPPKFCITFDFHFSWVLQPSRIKLREPLERGNSFLINKISNQWEMTSKCSKLRSNNELQSNGSTAKSWTFCSLLYGINHGKVSKTCTE